MASATSLQSECDPIGRSAPVEPCFTKLQGVPSDSSKLAERVKRMMKDRVDQLQSEAQASKERTLQILRDKIGDPSLMDQDGLHHACVQLRQHIAAARQNNPLFAEYLQKILDEYQSRIELKELARSSLRASKKQKAAESPGEVEEPSQKKQKRDPIALYRT